VKSFSQISKLSIYCLLAAIGSILLPTTATAAPPPRIDNQATSTYQDPDNPQKPLNAVSEILSIVVQEVAGIAVKPIDITRQDGGNISAATNGTVFFFNFEVQNVGTDTTSFFIPDQAKVGAIGTLQKIQYFDGSAWLDLPSGGYTSNPMAVNGRLSVRVVVRVTGAIGTLAVSLGNTAASDGQNQLRVEQSSDVYTVDAPDNTSGEFDGPPSNGVREAQATQSVRIGAQPEALTRVDLKVDQPFDPYDNTLSFALKLQVLASLPPNITNISPTDLTGLAITLDNQQKTGILVADAIPLGTEFRSATAPSSEWTLIYAYGDPIGANERADRLSWSTTRPTANTMAQVRRVGFFRTNYRMAQGASIDGFKVKVEIVDRTIDKIYNIAQAFGSDPADPNNSSNISPSTQIVYDESGDEQPNNYSYDGQPCIMGTDGQPLVNPGIVDPKVPAADPRSPSKIGEAKSTGSTGSPDGEFIQIPFQFAAPPDLKNGPREKPKAVGLTNDNDDFTNKSTAIFGDSVFDPAPLPFVNTVINTSDLTRDIKIIPSAALTTDLPEDTIVTLSDPADPSRTATFKYTKGAFAPEANSPPALVLSKITASASKDYGVLINLPQNTSVLRAFPVKLIAFIDSNDDNLPNLAEAQNATIDRVYTGFMQVVKESRVLALVDGKLQPVDGDNGKFSTADKSAQLNQYIEYRINYINISTPAPTTGNGNRTLRATNFGIIEDGKAQPNNWADFTANDPNSAQGDGEITYSNIQGASTTTDPEIIKYKIVLAKPVDPAQSGTFIFRRRVR
jgi:hypothetical protein